MKIWIKNLENGEFIAATFPRSLCTAAEFVEKYYPEIKKRKIFYKNPFVSDVPEDEKQKRINWSKIRLSC